MSSAELSKGLSCESATTGNEIVESKEADAHRPEALKVGSPSHC